MLVMFVDPFASVQLVREGKLRALGVTTMKWLSFLSCRPLAETACRATTLPSRTHVRGARGDAEAHCPAALCGEIDAIVKS